MPGKRARVRVSAKGPTSFFSSLKTMEGEGEGEGLALVATSTTGMRHGCSFDLLLLVLEDDGGGLDAGHGDAQVEPVLRTAQASKQASKQVSKQVSKSSKGHAETVEGEKHVPAPAYSTGPW